MVPLATVTVIGWTGDRFLPPIAGLDDTVATGGLGLGVGVGVGVGFGVGVGLVVVVEALVLAATLDEEAPPDDEPAGDDALALPPADPTVIGPPDTAVWDPAPATVDTVELPALCWPELAPCCGDPADELHAAVSIAVATTSVSTGAKPRVMRIVTSSRVSVPRD